MTTAGASDEMAKALRHWSRVTTSAGLRTSINLAAKHIEELDAELARFREAASTLARHEESKAAERAAASSNAWAWWSGSHRHPGWYPMHGAAELSLEEIDRNGYAAICAILSMNGIPAHPGDGTGMILNIIRSLALDRDRLARAAAERAEALVAQAEAIRTQAPPPACEETCDRSDCRIRGCLGGSP
jgi:hypothetical protein